MYFYVLILPFTMIELSMEMSRENHLTEQRCSTQTNIVAHDESMAKFGMLSKFCICIQF